MFNVGKNSVQDEDRPDRPTMVISPEIVNSVNTLILDERSVTVKNKSKKFGISVQNCVWWSCFLRSVVVGFPKCQGQGFILLQQQR